MLSDAVPDIWVADVRLVGALSRQEDVNTAAYIFLHLWIPPRPLLQRAYLDLAAHQVQPTVCISFRKVYILWLLFLGLVLLCRLLLLLLELVPVRHRFKAQTLPRVCQTRRQTA